MVAGLEGRRHLFGGEVRLQRLGEGMRPGSDLGHVCGRQPQHGVDHGERDDEGVVGDEVDLVTAGELVEEVVHDGRGLFPHPADGPGCEGALHQLAKARVVGWVQSQDGRGTFHLPVA